MDGDQLFQDTQCNSKGKRLKSNVWENMTRIMAPDSIDAECNHCKKRFKANRANGTSHLKRHIDKCAALHHHLHRKREKMADGKLGKAVMENEISHCDEHNQNLSIPQSNTTKPRKRKVKVAGDASILIDASASIKMKKKCKTTLTADGSERAAEVLFAVKSPAKVRPSSRVQSTKSATPLPPAPELPKAADGDGVNLAANSEMLGTGSCLQPEKQCPPAVVVTVDVERYKVKPELADTAQYILNKYGDLVSVTSFKGSLLTYLLENVCQIYQKLEKSELTDLTNAELVAMCIELCDFEKMNVNVGWLLSRLEDIQNAKKVLQELTEAKERCK